jgi:polar amino acid transport system substrate-binding protein
MKKIVPLVLAVLVCAALIFACARKTISTGKITTIEDLKGKVFGMLVVPVPITPLQVREKYGFLPSEVVSISSYNELLAALKSKRVDAIFSSAESNRYIMITDNEVTAIATKSPKNDGLRMLMRDTDTELLEGINSSIAQLKAEGVLDALYEKYVTNIMPGNVATATPEGVPVIEGADTILVGINGDLPPFDYVSVDGKPAGYNVALMAEISRILGKNMSFVSISTDARFSALLSKNTRRMDVFFWYYGLLDIDGLVLSDVYATFTDSILVRK